MLLTTVRSRHRNRHLAQALLLFVAAISALLIAPRSVAAHPLGNFSLNRYSRIEPSIDAISLRYIIDMAEIPTIQEQAQIDTNGDRTLAENERAAYLDRQLATIATQLHLSVGGQPLPLELAANSLAFLPGQGGLQTLRIEAEFRAKLPDGAGPWQAEFRDDNFVDRVGWHNVIVRASSSAQILESDVPTEDLSAELTNYPVDLLQNPPRRNTASFRFALQANSTTQGLAGAPVAAGRVNDSLSALVNMPVSGPLSLLSALVIAFGLGAAHALSPGHGKTIVGAYLVGARGTVGHALFLGITTTITHTAGVFALGLVTLFVSKYILPEQLYPWLGALSGALVCLIGLNLLRQRLAVFTAGPSPRDHSHNELDADGGHSHGFGYHSHGPVEQSAVSWRGLLALGVSGGLLPCPSALVVLLGSIALGRAGLGLLLVVAFSLGLAGVLTAIGILLVRSRGLFTRIPSGGRIMRLLPLAGAAVVTLAGLGITLQALAQAGLLHQ